MIPGIANPVSEINQLLFGQGQQGTFIAPSLTPALISGSTFGTGVETLPDLSPRNNPFSQANSGNRAAWFREPKTGRRNLLPSSERIFGNFTASGSPGGLAPTIQQNQIQSPFSSILADRVNFPAVSTASNFSVVNRLEISRPAGTYTFSVWLRGVAGGETVYLTLSNTIPSARTTCVLTTDWQRFSITFTSGTTGNLFANIGVDLRDPGQAAQLAQSIFAVGMQFEVGASPTQNQVVLSNFDVTEAGQRDCFGVRADGIDDGYETASIDFTGTNKVTVFAALRKLSDAANSIVVSNVNTATTATGFFALRAPSGATPNIRWQARELTGGAVQFADATVAANNTFIATGQTNGDTDIHSIRLNGVVADTATGDLGTGNFRAGTLQFLRNNLEPDAPFNGNLYALIVAGGSYPLSTIQRVERILSRITPTVNI